MKISDCITRARILIGDTETPYRFTDASFLLWAADGQQEIARRRPDSLLTVTGILDNPPETVLIADDLDIDAAFAQALVQYLCYQAWLSTGEHADNTIRADAHLKLFSAELS